MTGEQLREMEREIAKKEIDREYDLWIVDIFGNQLRFTKVVSVAHGRCVWQVVGAHGWDLQGFAIKDGEGKVLYEGSYVTDEC